MYMYSHLSYYLKAWIFELHHHNYHGCDIMAHLHILFSTAMSDTSVLCAYLKDLSHKENITRVQAIATYCDIFIYWI